MARAIDADMAKKIAQEYLTDPYHVISACAVIDKTPTLPQPSNEPLTLDGWVSVKDGLPKENKRVLVHVVNAPTLDVDTDRIVGGQWVRWAGSITHWMPLPDPPKKEN